MQRDHRVPPRGSSRGWITGQPRDEDHHQDRHRDSSRSGPKFMWAYPSSCLCAMRFGMRAARRRWSI